MSYAGNFVGQTVGQWLGAVETDPNAMYAALTGSGTITAELTSATPPDADVTEWLTRARRRGRR